MYTQCWEHIGRVSNTATVYVAVLLKNCLIKQAHMYDTGYFYVNIDFYICKFESNLFRKY
jgi:hypothetical protein